MGKVWVRAVDVFYAEKNGQTKAVEPGMWAAVGKHQARTLLANGQAEIPKEDTRAEVQGFEHCGVLIRGGDEADTDAFAGFDGKLRFDYGPPALPFDYTVIWKPPFPVTAHSIEVGLARLYSFEDTDAEPSFSILHRIEVPVTASYRESVDSRP